MPDTKISELPAAGTLTGSEPVPIVQGGNTVRTTATAIAGLASGSGTTTSFKWLGDYAGATNEAKLDALIATLTAGDTIVIPAGSIDITSCKNITGIDGLTWIISPQAVFTMASATAWGDGGDARFAGFRFRDCKNLKMEGGTWRMNSAAHAAKIGRWSCIFFGTANGGSPQPGTIVASDAVFERMNFDDVVTVAIFTRLADRITIRDCRFVRPIAAGDQNYPLVSILDGQGHKVEGCWASGGLASGSFNNGAIITNASFIVFSNSNPYEYYDPNPNTVRALHYRGKHVYTGSVNSFTVGQTANSGFDFHWTDGNANLRYDHTQMQWRFAHVAGAGQAYPADDMYMVTATNLVAQTFTVQPRNDIAQQVSRGAANGAAVILDGINLQAICRDVVFANNHMENFRGAAMFAWYVNNITAVGNTGKDCLDIFIDMENVWNGTVISNHYTRTPYVTWTNSAFSMLFAIENCTIAHNTIDNHDVSLEQGIDCWPNGALQRNLRIVENGGNGWQITVAAGADPGLSVNSEISGNTLSAWRGITAWMLNNNINLFSARRCRVQNNTFGVCNKNAILYNSCVGLEISGNIVVGGGSVSAVAGETETGGICSSTDVEIFDNKVLAFNTGAAAYVIHDGTPTGTQRVYNNRQIGMGGTAPVNKPQQWRFDTNAAMVPTGPDRIQVGGGWLRTNAGNIERSVDSTDGVNGSWTALTGGGGSFTETTAFKTHSGSAAEQARSTKARFGERMIRITDFIAAGATSVNQAVADALTELGSNRGVIWFPRGTYTISGGGITIANKTGVRLITDQGATLQAAAATAANKNVVGMGMVYLLLQQCTDCLVEGFDIDCNTNDGGGLGFDRCVGTTAMGVTVRRSNHLTFSSIQAAGGQNYEKPNRFIYCRVLGNGLTGNDTRGMMIGHYDSAATLENGVEVANCTVRDCNATGIVLVGKRQNVHHNHVANTGGSGIIFSGNLTFFCEGTRCHHNDVTGNLFQGIQGDHYNGAVSHGIEISGNKVWNNKTSGIYLWRMHGTSVNANTCWNNNSDNNILVAGIHAVESNFMTIVGNTCFDNNTTRTQTAGILIEANGLTSTDVMINGNLCYNNKQFGIYAQQIGTGRIDRIGIVGNLCRANDQGTTSYGIRGESNTSGNVTSGLISQNISTGHDNNTTTVGTGWTTANNI